MAKRKASPRIFGGGEEMTEFNLSEKEFETDSSSARDKHYVRAYHYRDVKEFIRLLKRMPFATYEQLELIDKLAGELLSEEKGK